MPRKLAVPGMVMCGDNVSMCSIPYLKGIHYAMHAGIYAAEAIVESLKKDPDSVNFEGYEKRVRSSDIEKDLYKSRNVRQHGDKGFLAFGAIANAWLLSGGALPPGHRPPSPTRTSSCSWRRRGQLSRARRRVLLRQTLVGLPLPGNATRDDAPNHVRIQSHVPREIAQTWVSMYPGTGLRDTRGPARIERARGGGT